MKYLCSDLFIFEFFVVIILVKEINLSDIIICFLCLYRYKCLERKRVEFEIRYCVVFCNKIYISKGWFCFVMGDYKINVVNFKSKVYMYFVILYLWVGMYLIVGNWKYFSGV